MRRVAPLLVLLTIACTASGAPAAKVPQSLNTVVMAFAGGCAGTVLTDAEPPKWAQGGWSHGRGTPWPVPWAMGQPGDSVAYLFNTQLVAGGSPRIDGTNNKILWVVRDPAVNFVIEGRPMGQLQPLVTIAGGPSITDVPSAGCWTFRLVWGPADNTRSSIISLDALPAGTLPAQ